MQVRVLVCILSLTLTGVGVSRPAEGLDPEDRSAPPVRSESMLSPSFNHYWSGWKQVFQRKQNLYWLGMAAGSFLAVRPFDEEISKNVDGTTPLVGEAVDFIGGAMVLGGSSVLTHVTGRITGDTYFANTGLYMIEALVSTYALTLAGKYVIQRARPTGDNTRSFPSGHTSGMFALASVLDQRYGWKIGVPAYLLAGYTGVSRVRQLRHYPTDVLAGAALGIIIGRSVVPSKPDSITILPLMHPASWLLHFQVQF